MHEHAHHSGLPLQSSRTGKDPVCGMQVAADTPHRYTHGGKRVSILLRRLSWTIRKNPEKYLAKAGRRRRR